MSAPAGPGIDLGALVPVLGRGEWSLPAGERGGHRELFAFGLRSAPPAPSGTPASVALRDPEYLRQFSVQLRARIVPRASHWTDRFEYGTTTAYGSYTKRCSESDDGDGVYLDTYAGGLAPGTTYH